MILSVSEREREWPPVAAFPQLAPPWERARECMCEKEAQCASPSISFVARCSAAKASAVYGGAHYTYLCNYHGSTCGTCIPIFVSI